MKFLLLALALSLVTFSLTNCNQSQFSGKTPPKAVKGELNLSDWDFEKDGPVTLAGEWQFYWMQLLTAEQINRGEGKLTSISQVPGIWNNYKVNGENLPGKGYATYVLNIKKHQPTEAQLLQLNWVSTAHKIFINGEFSARNGIVSTEISEIEGQYRPVYIPLKKGEPVKQIIVHIGNSQHRKGGFDSTIEIGKAEVIQSRRIQKIMLDLFLFGAILIMGMYHLGLYFFRRQDRAALYFGLFCLLIAIRILVTGNRYLQSTSPLFSYEVMLKLEYLTFYLGGPIFVLFVSEFFPQNFSKYVLKFVTWMGFGSSLLIVILPAFWLSQTLFAYQLFTLLCGIYVIYIGIQGLYFKRENAGLFTMGWLVLFLGILVDISKYRYNLQISDIAPFGLFLFIFVQSAMLSRRFAKAFVTVEVQASALKKADKLKDEFLANLSHELNTPLSSIYGFSEMMLDAGNLNESKDYAKDILQNSEILQKLIDDLLLMTKLDSLQNLETGKVNMDELIGKATMQWQQLISQKKISLNTSVASELQVVGNEYYLTKALSHIVKNAIIYNHEQGSVSIEASQVKTSVILKISDSGQGIKTSDLSYIWDKFYRADTSLTYKESGTGLGLYLARIIIEMHSGSINLESTLDKGTVVTIQLPVND